MRHLRFCALAATLILTAAFDAGRAQQPSAAKTLAASQSSGGLLDINMATLDQLKSLPGMGEAYARRVIAGRPYTAKNQLVTRGVLPQPAYDAIQTRIVAKHTK